MPCLCNKHSLKCCTAKRAAPICIRNKPAHQATVAARTERLEPSLGFAATVLSSLLGSAGYAAAQEAATQTAVATVQLSKYTPSPYTPGWEVWFGAVAATIPFVIGASEFTKRVLIQLRCPQCEGSGLVQRGKYKRKCPQCGGFFPWVSWQQFIFATATPGNGGPLLQPKGQKSIFYEVPPPLPPKPAAKDEGTEAAVEQTTSIDSSKADSGPTNS